MPNPVVNPTASKPTHHVLLTDGVVSVGLIAVDSNQAANPRAISRAPAPRTALKTATGSTKYSDFNFPWTPISQEDFSGGRGSQDFDVDTTRYFDDYQVNTVFGTVTLGPLPQYSTGFYAHNMPGSVKFTHLIGSSAYLATQIDVLTSFTASDALINIKRIGTPAKDLTVRLMSISGGLPDQVLATGDIAVADIDKNLSRWIRKTFDATTSLTATTGYWLEVFSEDGTEEDHWAIATQSSPSSVISKISSDGATYNDSNVDLYYRITPVKANYNYKFFQYKGAQYAIRQTGTGAPTLLRNGYRGAADSNSTNLSRLYDATQSWGTLENGGFGELKDGIVWIISGPGSEEEKPWRRILSNGADELTVDTPWIVTHTTATNYVILGVKKWIEITGHGITVPVTNKPLVINDIVYFPLGDDTEMRRMREYNNAGVWTVGWDADTGNKAVCLAAVRDATNGLEIWRALNKDSSGYISVSKAAVIDWSGTDLSFGAPTNTTLKDQWGKIINILEYGDTTKQLWILREGTVMTLSSGKPDEIPLSEMHSLMSYVNGKSFVTHNVYLYFNLGQRIEKYYNRSLEDVGPNRDEGLPDNRQGYCSCMAGMAGTILFGINGESDNFSSVLAQNLSSTPGGGFCELFRSPNKGDQVWDIQYQPMYGHLQSGFWCACGDDILWIPFSIDKESPLAQYTHESALVSGYCYASLYDVYKLYKSVRIFAENLKEDEQFIEFDYRTDDEEEWTILNDEIYQSVTDVELTDTHKGVTAKRLQWRIRIQSTDHTKSPLIKALAIEAVSRIPIKYSFAFSYRNKEHDVDLNGEPDEMSAEDRQDIIDSWAENLVPLKMRCIRHQYDDQIVFIEGVPTSPTAEMSEDYSSRLTLIQL